MPEQQTEQVISEAPDKLKGERRSQQQEPSGKRYYKVTLTALGVVFGDIGTSPLYALRECFQAHRAIHPTPANVLGILSLIFWSLILVISVKYLMYVMRADNEGEGGILALMALVGRPATPDARRRWGVIALGIFGAALLYGDGMITPAISVLSAIEGLTVASPVFKPHVLTITCAILVMLFVFQRRGTAGVGTVFGPVMLVWFFTLAILGTVGITRQPQVLTAINPIKAVSFFVRNGWPGFLVIGAVFLVVTGGEALYADLGHFTRRTIRSAWFGLVLPGLLLNYFGQGALLLEDPGLVGQPFYRLAPAWATYPLVGLAAMATVIASQAVISGAYSLTRQAAFLELFPRVRIVQTSMERIGQIYVPVINWILMAATIAFVLTFRSSSRLAGAYGIAVSTTMVITTLLAFTVARHRWDWPAVAAVAVTAAWLLLDLAFFGANLFRVVKGGWVPLLVAAFFYLLMATWKSGRRIQAERLRKDERPIGDFLQAIESDSPLRVPGTAIFLSDSPEGVPPILNHHLKRNQVLHEKVILLTVVIKEVPRVWGDARIELTELKQGFSRVVMQFGYMENCNVPEALKAYQRSHEALIQGDVTYYVGGQTLIPTKNRKGMAVWRESLYAFMARNSTRSVAFYQLPPKQVMGIVIEVEL
jgi:KUP system potassium uptake protein